jgi:ATP-dependent 26S proteasome regulatory subunit
MLELLNQLDGFDSRGDVKVNIIVVDILHLLKACVQLCLMY